MRLKEHGRPETDLGHPGTSLRFWATKQSRLSYYMYHR